MVNQREQTVPKLLRTNELEDLVVESFRNAGANVIILDRGPLKLSIATDVWQKKLIIHIWNITHGGKTRNPNEYRIQMKGDGLKFETGFSTLLLGWFNEEKTFAAFNAKKHAQYGKSPSVQVSLITLQEANKRGVAFHTKFLKNGSQEIVVAFQPNHVIEYVNNIYNNYHEVFKPLPKNELKTLEKPLDEKISNIDLVKIDKKRRSVVVTLNKKIRLARFRKDISSLYSGRCAICGIQGRLTEAAHIIPVGEDGSDEIGNGILLCKNHHRAYDLGLIAIRDDFSIVYSESRLKELEEKKLIDGMDRFIEQSRIHQKIFLPEKTEYYPNVEYLKANCASKDL